MTHSVRPEATAGGLALLVETEDRLEAMLAERREEAARLVEEARRETAARLAGLETSLAEDQGEIRAAIEARAREQASASARDAEERAQRFRGIPDARVEALARFVVERVLSLTPGTA